MDKKLEEIFDRAINRRKKNLDMEFLVFPGKQIKSIEKKEIEPCARLDKEKNYVEFNEEYRKIAHLMKEFKPLLNYMKRKKYSSNLD